jgi:hypothetical protein
MDVSTDTVFGILALIGAVSVLPAAAPEFEQPASSRDTVAAAVAAGSAVRIAVNIRR